MERAPHRCLRAELPDGKRQGQAIFVCSAVSLAPGQYIQSGRTLCLAHLVDITTGIPMTRLRKLSDVVPHLPVITLVKGKKLGIILAGQEFILGSASQLAFQLEKCGSFHQ